MEPRDDDMPPPMALALCASFGSVAAWRSQFAQQARDAPVGLCFVAGEGRLVHRAHAHPGERLLLCARAGEAIDWAQAYQRYQDAVHEASQGLGVAPDAASDALLVDVRRAAVYQQADSCIPGAQWRDPAAVDEWAAELPPDRALVVYCVYGHEVGRNTALRLRAKGLNAHFLEGGIEGWRTEGRPLVAKGDMP